VASAARGRRRRQYGGGCGGGSKLPAAAAMWQLQLMALVAAGSVSGSLTMAGRQRQRGGATVAAAAWIRGSTRKNCHFFK
jgi:hypothetical protein